MRSLALEPSTCDGVRVAFRPPTVEASRESRRYPKQGAVVGCVDGVAAAGREQGMP